ncbi:MAG: hypothetical protein ACI805_001526, partial [Candidatus Azotimanducaceae bacterium]
PFVWRSYTYSKQGPKSFDLMGNTQGEQSYWGDTSKTRP